MVFERMTDAMKMIKNLKTIYTTVRLIDTSSNTVIYESSEPFQLAPDIGECSTHLKPIDLKMTVTERTVEIQITAPVQIERKDYLLELNQIAQTELNQIMEMAVTDSLTKLYNRRYIDERLPIDMQTCFAMDEPLSILFMDIDFFKSINDANGHMAGDQILQHVSRLLQKQIRKGSGWIARYGGDEILICLPGISNKVAKTIANRIRKSIESNRFNIGVKKILITCSIGVQTVRKDIGTTNVSKILTMADEKLYCAKQRGRNRVF